MMKRNYLSDRTVLAMYLALCAGRKRTSVVYVTNDHLRWYLGKCKGRRLSKPLLREFAATLKPIFPRHVLKLGKDGLYLVLYLNENSDSSVKVKAERVVFEGKAIMYEALGVQVEG